MRRTLILFLIVIAVLPVMAQTNFRSLTLSEAIQTAKLENKLVFIDFYTTWCGPCKMMMKNVFPQPKVGEYFNNKYVCIKLDAEKEGKEAAQRFEVKAYPTFIVLDANEKVLLKREGGNSDGNKFISEIEMGVNPEMTPTRLAERYASGERTPQLIDAYATLKMNEARQGRRMNQQKVDEAHRIILDYFNGLTDEQKLSAPNAFLYSYTYTQSVTDPKAVYMIANRGKFAKEIAEDIEGCDLAGFNSNRFDIPLLVEEFLRAGVDIDLQKRKFIDVQVIYHKLEQRTLSAAYKFYCNKNLEDAHSAAADTHATYEVLKAQLDHYPDVLENDVKFLSEYSCYSKNVDFAGRIVYNEQGIEIFNFGKYKGISVEEVLLKDPGYYGWILNGDFTLNTKNVLTKIKLRSTGMLR